MTILKIEVLENGTVRVETDEVMGVHHLSAEQFLEFMKREMGGEVTTVKKPGAHTHHHRHQGHSH